MEDGLLNRSNSVQPEGRSNKTGETPHHKGVRFIAKSNKYGARLCLPGGHNRKLDLSEYNSHDAAEYNSHDAADRAYRAAAFYYNKLDSKSKEGESFVESLPCIQDNLSDADKLIWVREQARQYATSERPLLHRGASTLQQSFVFEAAADHGAQGLYDSSPTLLITSEGAGEQYFPSYDDVQNGGLNLNPLGDFQFLNVDAVPSDGQKRRKRLNVEVQVGRTAPDQVPASELRMTDSILAAHCELRKQGWGWTVKLQSFSSVEAGVLVSLPRSHEAAPALVMTESIISAFQELGEQGWEVRLEPTKCDNF